ncbi:histidinol-phosphate transaminase [Fibrella forsythiae]|uniref:Histidinol-phosphate aminotransferase n=1 Tax=Fibrella forsythiae TaxID=2817061 RepID=A0ABS3JFB0_9BACT|nr:histidinol-phosphate transaminase [Fibrella forsythiae]MBO0947597.1 histidinol-phosphate transaminase [Fibrella forsythiae]
MFDLAAVLRPHIASLTPYSSARDEYTGTEGVFLDANENALGSTTHTGHYNRYPDPHQTAIKARLAPLKGVQPTQLFLGNGSDEPIDLLVRATCRPGIDNVLLLPPTYGMYEVSARLNDVLVKKVPLTTEYQLDLPAVLAAIDAETKIIWICSPNNPSGNLIDPAAISAVLDAAKTALVVVDEAYIDFAGPDYASWTTYLETYPNLVILQTFSKAWGLAALRLGMCFASAELIRIMNVIKPPYNISAPSQALALDALDNVAEKERMVMQTVTERNRLAHQLGTLPNVQHIFPSDANFLLVRFDEAHAVFEQLIDSKVIVRDRSSVTRCEDCLRITVGTEAENARLLAVLHAIAVPI